MFFHNLLPNTKKNPYLRRNNVDSMITRKRILTILSLSLTCICVFSQSSQQAKAWFDAGDYERALPAYKRIVKNNPRNGTYNYRYAVCLYETGDKASALPYFEKAAEREITNAYRYMGDYHQAIGDYENAIRNWETYVDEVSPTDTLYKVYVRKLAGINKELKYVKRVEKLLIVDSIVLPKKKFLTAYGFGAENGTIGQATRMTDDCQTSECTAYQTERGDKIYYSNTDVDGSLQLYMRYRLMDDWSKPTRLNGFPDDGDNNYPFMLSDGMTIYFANNGSGGLGGYDLYITRYNSETERFLTAENLGMPFNSSANDYMLAIDETYNLGWFATDRNQPEDSVCIYTFVPTTEKKYYDYQNDNRLQIIDAARITSIEATQTDEKALRNAQQSLFKLSIERTQKEEEKHDFTFVIDDFTDYHRISDFKSTTAREMFTTWEKQKAQLEKLHASLEEQRAKYTRSSMNDREKMSTDLLQIEQKYEQLEIQVIEMEISIRNEENNYISNGNK